MSSCFKLSGCLGSFVYCHSRSFRFLWEGFLYIPQAIEVQVGIAAKALHADDLQHNMLAAQDLHLTPPKRTHCTGHPLGGSQLQAVSPSSHTQD